jgi:hypothetical protein
MKIKPKIKEKIHGARNFIRGFLTCAIVFSLITGAAAASRTIQATLLYRDIKIEIDGGEIMPRDAAGNIVEPFIIDGTTYLPVRAVAEALGMEVGWDDATSTVRLISKQREHTAQEPTAPSSPPESSKSSESPQTTQTPTTRTRVFEDEFLNENKPLGSSWQAEPRANISFAGAIGESGLTLGRRGARLTLTGFSIENANNFTVEFYAMAQGHRSTFVCSLGTDEDGNWINTFELQRTKELRFGGTHIGNFVNNFNTWHSVKIEVANQEALVYIDGQLITLVPQKLDKAAKQQISFNTLTHEDTYWISDFKVTVND